jgi:large subunit ribosomal protein L11
VNLTKWRRKTKMPIVKLIVDGGSMKPGPAVAQQLGPMGINLGKVIEEVNKATAGFKGTKVPVEIDVDPKTKNFTINVFSPPVSELIKKEIKVDKGSGKPLDNKVGNLSIEQVISIAKTKMPGMLAKDLKAAVKLVVGSCVSLGVLIETREAKDVMQEVEAGNYDKEIKAEKTETAPDKLSRLQKEFSDIKTRQDAASKAAEAAKAAEDAAKAEAAAAAPAPATTTAAAPAKGAAKAPAAKPAAKKK